MTTLSRQNFKSGMIPVLHGLLGAFLILPVILFYIIVQVPIYLHRWILTKLIAPCFRPRIGKTVSVGAQYQAAEFLGKGPFINSKYAIIVKLVLSGPMSLDELRQLILERWINAMENGVKRYPEFQQFIEFWWGFMFWKLDQKFDINNHIIDHELDESGDLKYSRDFLSKLEEELLNQPFRKNRSPWEVHLVRKFKFGANTEDKNELAVLMLRVHHSFVDGIILNGLFGDNLEKAYSIAPGTVKVDEPSNCIPKIGNIFEIPFRFLRDSGHLYLLTLTRPQVWKRSKKAVLTYMSMDKGETVFTINRKQILSRSPLISMKALKLIKNHFEVSFSSVLLSCVSASLANNFQNRSRDKVWNDVRINMRLPFGGHENKLGLNTMSAIFPLIVSHSLSPQERMKLVENHYTKSKNPMSPWLMLPYGDILSGSLAYPFAFATFVNNEKCAPVCCSNVPGPREQFRLDENRQVLEMDVSAGTSSDVTFTMFSYYGFMNVTVVADEGVLDKSEVDKLVKNFCKELEVLYGLTKAQI